MRRPNEPHSTQEDLDAALKDSDPSAASTDEGVERVKMPTGQFLLKLAGEIADGLSHLP